MNRRNQSLDALRGVAVLMVIGHHYGYYQFWSRYGGLGVDLFFVLSGYLISGLLFAEHKRTGSIDVGRFLLRRGFKIYPPYYFMVLLLLPFTFHSVTWADFTFMGSYFPILWGHAWSLSVEEHFYFLLPVILLVSARMLKNFDWIPWAMPVLAVACLALRYRYALSHSVVYGVTATHLRLDSLFAGVTLSWFQHYRAGIVRLSYGWAIGVLGLALLSLDLIAQPAPIAASFGIFTAMCGCSAMLVWALNTAWIGKLKPLSNVGISSYSIYLWHWPIARIFEGEVPSTRLSFWIYVSTCLAVGTTMAKLIEIPALRLRQRLIPSDSLNRNVARDLRQQDIPLPVDSKCFT